MMSVSVINEQSKNVHFLTIIDQFKYTKHDILDLSLLREKFSLLNPI
jgi:hypothetical protein